MKFIEWCAVKIAHLESQKLGKQMEIRSLRERHISSKHLIGEIAAIDERIAIYREVESVARDGVAPTPAVEPLET
jgi:hypothetical protein